MTTSSSETEKDSVTVVTQPEEPTQQQQQQQQLTFSDKVCNLASAHFNLAKDHFTAFYLSSLSMNIGLAVFSSLLPISLRQLGNTDDTIGWIVALIGLGRVVAEIPIAMLSLKFGPWIIAIVSTVLLTAVTLVPTFELTTWSFIFAQALGGLFTAGYATSRHEFLQQAFKKSERTMVSSHMGAIGRISFLVAPSCGGYLMQEYGATYAYLFGVILLIMTCVSSFSPELIQIDAALRKKHDDAMNLEKKEMKIKKIKQELAELKEQLAAKKQEVPVAQVEITNDDEKDDAELVHKKRNNSSSEEEETQTSSATPTPGSPYYVETPTVATPGYSSSVTMNVPSQFPPAVSLYVHDDKPSNENKESKSFSSNNNNEVEQTTDDQHHHKNKNKSADEQHYSSPLQALKVHWKTVLGVGFLVVSIMSLRQARRLTITLRAMDLGYEPRDVGLFIAGSFSVDTVFFWASSTLVNHYGYSYALAPLCFFYGLAFLILSYQPADGNPLSLFLGVPCFGIGDSFGAGIILSLISEMVPRALVGVTRIALDGGVLIGPLLTGFLAHHFGLSTCCLVLFVWCIIAATFAIGMLRGGVGKQYH